MNQWKATETQEQIAVADYLRLKDIMFIHVPNEGKRSPTTARLLKAMGMKPGFPDLLILEPRGEYHGLAIELKIPGGRLSYNQKEWLADLASRRYAAVAAWGADEAIHFIEEYMKLGEYHDKSKSQDD